MPFSFLPTFRCKKMTDLSPERLQQAKIELLMLDFDNTIVPYTTNLPTEETKAWLCRMSESGIRLCVVSNSRNDRVPKFCGDYGLDCITHARKPFPKGIRQCLDRYGIAPEHAALVGDQIYTDVLGANSVGIRSILVEAIDNHNIWLKLRHVAELPFIYFARNRRI